ncbi:MAG: hypothetical protein JO236_11545 [Mycobacterium sp.]|uniref:hypothetical protein n=1 Tax=Mycobacterium sp. TaxID=1785 RepID=UPI001EBDE9A9|nr:hypothetical protein [Mycobacterium sp.]MBW0018162.1 hypothetical protein [Mycobacterium sp.]
MALFYSLVDEGVSSALWDALLQISGCDPGLQSTAILTQAQVTYAPQKPSNPATMRLQRIVDSPASIVLHSVNPGFIDPWGGVLMYGGLTYYPDGNGPANIWIDMTQAGAQGYRELDPQGNYISAPNAVILYHELAHAFHGVVARDSPTLRNTGDPDTDNANLAADQLMVIADENQFRQVLGLPLRIPTLQAIDGDDYLGPPTVGPASLNDCNDGVWSLDCLVDKIKQLLS